MPLNPVCQVSVGNTGTATTPFIGAPRKLFFRPRFDYNGNQNTIGLTGTGNKFPGSVAQSVYTVTGTSTTFLTSFNIGDTYAPTGGTPGIVTAIASNTSMTVSVLQTITAGTTYNIFGLSYIIALTLQPDPSKRLYPVPTVKDGYDERNKSIMETYEDDSQEKIQKGIRKIYARLTRENQGALPYLEAQLNVIWSQGIPMDVYYLDLYGNFVGAYNTTGQLDGRQIDAGSFDAIFNPGRNKQGNKTELEMNVHIDEVDALIYVIKTCEMDSTIQTKLGSINGLLDTTATYASLATSGYTVTLATQYGTPLNPVNATGLTLANYTSATAQPVKTLTISTLAMLVGDIVVGEVSNAVGQVVKVTSGTSIDVVILSGAFNSDVACRTFRQSATGVYTDVTTSLSLSPDISAVAAATYTAYINSTIYDSSISPGIYVPLASVVETKSNGRPIGVYAVTFLTGTDLVAGTNIPTTSDICQPYITNIQGSSLRYYDFTSPNTTTIVV